MGRECFATGHNNHCEEENCPECENCGAHCAYGRYKDYTGNQDKPVCFVCGKEITKIGSTYIDCGYINFSFGYYSCHDEGVWKMRNLWAFICDDCISTRKDRIMQEVTKSPMELR
jgi:hypothetical protein